MKITKYLRSIQHSLSKYSHFLVYPTAIGVLAINSPASAKSILPTIHKTTEKPMLVRPDTEHQLPPSAFKYILNNQTKNILLSQTYKDDETGVPWECIFEGEKHNLSSSPEQCLCHLNNLAYVLTPEMIDAIQRQVVKGNINLNAILNLESEIEKAMKFGMTPEDLQEHLIPTLQQPNFSDRPYTTILKQIIGITNKEPSSSPHIPPDRREPSRTDTASL